MVTIKYNGTLGNKMWQYASVSSFCKLNNLSSNLESIEYFPNTNVNNIGSDCNENKTIVTGHHLPSFNKDNCNYEFNGYFQRYENIKKNKNYVKELFNLNINPPINTSDNDIVLTIRRGWNNYPTNLCPSGDYFLSILSNINYDRIILCTDTFEDGYFNFLKNIKTEIIYAKFSPIEQFSIIKNSNKVIISPSTFSWWGAFLSNATEIYYPMYSDLIPTENNQNWVVDDEERYKYISI